MPRLVQSLERGLAILSALGDEPAGLSLTELTERVGLHKSTVHRLLTTLRQHRFADLVPATQRYRCGLKVLLLSSTLLASMEMRAQARPALEALRDATGEMVHLAVLDEGRVVYVEKLECTYPGMMRVFSRVGLSAPAYCTGLGKALLAHLPEPELEAFLARTSLVRHTENTICTAEELRAELERVRVRGYSTDNEEHEQGVRCVGAPVRDHSGRVVAAVSVAAPAFRLTREREQGVIPLVKEASARVSEALGYNIAAGVKEERPLAARAL